MEIFRHSSLMGKVLKISRRSFMYTVNHLEKSSNLNLRGLFTVRKHFGTRKDQNDTHFSGNQNQKIQSETYGSSDDKSCGNDKHFSNFTRDENHLSDDHDHLSENRTKEFSIDTSCDFEKTNHRSDTSHTGIVNKYDKKTHYICLPIADTPDFRLRLSEFEQRLLKSSPEMSDFVYKKFHRVTICAMNLTPEQELIAINNFDDLAPKIRSITKRVINEKGSFSCKLTEQGYFGKYESARVFFYHIEPSLEETFQKMADLTIRDMIVKKIIEKRSSLARVRFNNALNRFELVQLHVTMLKQRDNNDRFNMEKVVAMKGFTFPKVEFRTFELRKLDKEQTKIASFNL